MANLLSSNPIPLGSPVGVPEETVSSGAKPLPYNAIGWTPKGEAYYGDGLVGWARKISGMVLDPEKMFGSSMTKDPNDPTKQISILDKYNVNLPQVSAKPGEFITEEQLKTKNLEMQKQLGQIDAKEWWEIVKNDPGMVVRTGGGLLAATFWGGLDVANQLQVMTRKVAAASLGAAMMEEVQKKYPNASDATIYKQFMGSSEAIYTAWLDGNKRDQYMQMVMDGVPPAFVVEKLANPLIELGGSIILDPMNIIFGAGILPDIGKAANVASDFLKVSDDGVRIALKAAGDIKDEMLVGEVLADVGKAVSKALENVATKQATFANSRGLFSKIAASKSVVTTHRLNEVFGFILQQEGKNADGIAEIVSLMVRTGSKNLDEASLAALALAKKPYSNILFSNAGLEAQLVLQKLTEGDIPKFLGQILENSKDSEKLVAFVTKRVADAVENLYPTVADMESAAIKVKNAVEGATPSARTIRLAQQYNELKPYIKSLAKVDTFLQQKLILGKWGYRDLNHFFSSIYMGMSPGYAVRNLLTNTVHLLADKGPITASKGFGLGIMNMIDGALGRPTALFDAQLKNIAEWGADTKYTAAAQGIGISGETAGKSFFDWGMRRGQEAERGASLAIWGDAFATEMKRALRQGAIPNISTLTDGGMPKEMADGLVRLIIDNKGNVRKAVRMFKKATATGKLDAWRYAPIDTYLEKFLDSSIVMRGDDYRNLRKNSVSAEEFEVKAEELIRDVVRKIKEGVSADGITYSTDPETMKLIDGISDTIKKSDGLFTQDQADKLGAIVNLERQARIFRNESATLIKDTILKNHGAQITPDVFKTVENAYVDIVEKMGAENYANWDKVGDSIWGISNSSKREGADLQKLSDMVIGIAKKNGYSIPVLDVTDASALRNTLWDWYPKAGNEHFYNFSKRYNEALWTETVLPLTDSLGIDIRNSKTLSQFLVAEDMPGIASKLDLARQSMDDALDLINHTTLEDWTGVKKFVPSFDERVLQHFEHTKSIIAKYTNFTFKKTDEGFLSGKKILVSGNNPIGKIPEDVREAAFNAWKADPASSYSKAAVKRAAEAAKKTTGNTIEALTRRAEDLRNELKELQAIKFEIKTIDNSTPLGKALEEYTALFKGGDDKDLIVELAKKYDVTPKELNEAVFSTSNMPVGAEGIKQTERMEQIGNELLDIEAQLSPKAILNEGIDVDDIERLLKHGEGAFTPIQPADAKWLTKSQVKVNGQDVRGFTGTTFTGSELSPTPPIHVSDDGFYSAGIYLDLDPEKASAWATRTIFANPEDVVPGGNVRPFWINVENPFKTWDMKSMRRWGETPSEQTKNLIKAGYDGVFKMGDNNEIVEIVVYRTDQLRPALSPQLPLEEALKVRAIPQAVETFSSIPRVLHEQIENVIPIWKMEINKAVNAWGKTTDVFTNPSIEAAMGKWEFEATKNVAEARAYATKYADNARNFALLNYGDRTYADKMLGYIYPYHFWYGRTYKNWMSRIVNNPTTILAYKRYRTMLEQLHAGMPSWWKYNLSTNDLPGMDSENPLYFNLEATINPLNGLVGIDFNDPNKRVNWWSKAIDDVGKFGPTLFTPINWIVAAGLAIQGEEDAAVRWMGRLFPQTAMLKSVAYKLGVKSPLPYNELDPFVQFFSGGLDPYERRRVGRTLGKMVDDGTITTEAAQDSAHSQKGDVWNQAVSLAQGDRAAGNMSSFFAGAGFKARNQSDMQIDEFYSKYFGLWNMKDSLSPDEFSDGMRQLREQYPWMDTLLISRKPDDQRDGAFAYSVMSRVPPGQKTDMMKMLGIDDLQTKFYESKGDLTGWSQPDKDRFMAAIADMGAVLAVPDSATQGEYYKASDSYSAMNNATIKQFGKSILDKIDMFYQLEDDKKDVYVQLNPDVQAALTFKNEYILTDPILNKYYGGIALLEQYYISQLYDTLRKEYGDDIQAKWAEYDVLQLQSPTQARAYKKAHPELDAYTERKGVLRDNMTKIIIELGANFPEAPQVPIRTDITNPSDRQQSIVAGTQPQPVMTWQDWQMLLNEPLQALILDYLLEGKELPYSANYQLNYIATGVGLSGSDEALQAIGIAIQKP